MSGEVSLFLADDKATGKLGAALAGSLRPGDLVSLAGELGTGKTALARAIIRSLTGDPAMEVPSPSFALVQPYQAGEQVIIHADLYRLSDAAETEELGLFDDADAIVLIEWAERDPELLAGATIAVTLTLGPEGQGRLARIETADPARVKAFADAAAAEGLKAD